MVIDGLTADASERLFVMFSLGFLSILGPFGSVIPATKALEACLFRLVAGWAVFEELRFRFSPDRSAMVGFSVVILLRRWL
jgi:hypothetical protein